MTTSSNADEWGMGHVDLDAYLKRIGTNSLLQAAKARARGYRNKRHMITVICLIAAKLPRPSLSVTHSN